MYTLIPVLTFLALSAPPDYQKVADDTKWEWNDENATAVYSAKNLPDGYKIDIVDKKQFAKATLKFSEDGKEVYTLEGHLGTVFVIKDNVLYYADYDPISDGCSLVARDLAHAKELWKTPLQALGPIPHSKYRNQVSLDWAEGALRVFGHESAGNYVEFVDPKAGKTVGHKVFKNKLVDSSNYVKVTAKANPVDSDGSRVIDVTLTIDKGWHLYANPSGPNDVLDDRVELRIESKGKPVTAKVDYPEGKLVKNPERDVRIYEGTITIKATVKRADLPDGPLDVKVWLRAVNWSRAVCILPAEIELPVP
jgi:hypothetical protein